MSRLAGVAGPCRSTRCPATATWTLPGGRRPAAPTTGSEQLADLSRETRPAGALALYLRLVEPLKELTGGRVHERMAQLLLDARTCRRAQRTQDEFTAYLTALRTDLQRRHKLTSIFYRHGL
ncbi:hypothetical protein [Streptomyces poonensis]|uniref:Uncharacterized protein n=1 Tax=Streptomyces poonensis TaxID=68255 RepID=A0A918UFS3_9ACTN|nr:hypothetical protein [Streptomyces poonensis]GGZ01617.1 hypothetical protein GCM10010365_20810 [Streptomyces poonensis]